MYCRWDEEMQESHVDVWMWFSQLHQSWTFFTSGKIRGCLQCRKFGLWVTTGTRYDWWKVAIISQSFFYLFVAKERVHGWEGPTKILFQSWGSVLSRRLLRYRSSLPHWAQAVSYEETPSVEQPWLEGSGGCRDLWILSKHFLLASAFAILRTWQVWAAADPASMQPVIGSVSQRISKVSQFQKCRD